MEMIATPRPPRTFGRLVDFAYTRRPGFEIRLMPHDRALAVRAELQLEDEVLADLGVLDLPAGDEALLLEDLRDVRLDLAVRHHDVVVVRRVRVTQTREHVCDGISHGHELAFGLSRRGFLYAPSLSPLSGGTGAVRGPTA